MVITTAASEMGASGSGDCLPDRVGCDPGGAVRSGVTGSPGHPSPTRSVCISTGRPGPQPRSESYGPNKQRGINVVISSRIGFRRQPQQSSSRGKDSRTVASPPFRCTRMAQRRRACWRCHDVDVLEQTRATSATHSSLSHSGCPAKLMCWESEKERRENGGWHIDPHRSKSVINKGSHCPFPLIFRNREVARFFGKEPNMRSHNGNTRGEFRGNAHIKSSYVGYICEGLYIF